jgi:hypothetical protein
MTAAAPFEAELVDVAGSLEILELGVAVDSTT